MELSRLLRLQLTSLPFSSPGLVAMQKSIDAEGLIIFEENTVRNRPRERL